MKLIAKRPCSFGGKQFFIGDEVPVSFVADVKMQERLGVLLIANDETAGSRKRSKGTAAHIKGADV